MSDSDYPQDLTGHFLISETELRDPNFFQTVVLIVTHNEDGAFGLVVNRPSEANLGDLLDEFEEAPGAEIPVYVGGPVQQEYLFVLHSGLPDDEASEVASTPVPGVIFEPSFDIVGAYLQAKWEKVPADDRPKIHLFAGYAGWGPGQLEEELALGSWVTHPASADIVFTANPEKGWRQALREKGSIYWVVAETGYKPSMN